MKNKNIKIMLIIIGIFILIISIFYRNSYIVKNNKQIIKEMDESTQVTSLNNTINELNKAHEEYQKYIQDCKNQIANAITEKGIDTNETDTISDMVENIKRLEIDSKIEYLGDCTIAVEDSGGRGYVATLPNITDISKYKYILWAYYAGDNSGFAQTCSNIQINSGSCDLTILCTAIGMGMAYTENTLNTDKLKFITNAFASSNGCKVYGIK